MFSGYVGFRPRLQRRDRSRLGPFSVPTGFPIMPFGTRSVFMVSPDGFMVNRFLEIVLSGGTHAHVRAVTLIVSVHSLVLAVNTRLFYRGVVCFN